MSGEGRGSQMGFTRRPPTGSARQGLTSTPPHQVHDRRHTHLTIASSSTIPPTTSSSLGTTSKAAPTLKTQYQASPPTVAHHHLRYNPYTPVARLHIPVPKAVQTSLRVDEGILRDAVRAVASAEAGEETMKTEPAGKLFMVPEGHRRKKEPPIYNKVRGNKAMALAVAQDSALREEALKSYRKDQRSDGDTSHFNFKTWCEVHDAWWSFDGLSMVEALPLTPKKIECVGAALKASGYRSAGNYMTAAKNEHLAEGYKWDARLDRAAALFNASCSRGLGPARQSEPLPFEDALAMKWKVDPAVAGGPVNTKATII